MNNATRMLEMSVSDQASPFALDSAATSTLDLLVLIFSRPDEHGRLRRASVRSSWASGWKGHGRVTIKFMLGRSVVANATVESQDDLVLLPVPEGYAGLSRKVLSGMGWAVANVRFRFLLKTDDDSFVCVGGLLRWLSDAVKTSNTSNLYAGVPLAQRCVGLELVPLFKQVGKTFRDVRCRRGWAYPKPTMHGAGYILSASLVHLVVSRWRHLRPLPSAEDVTVSLLMRYSGPASLSLEPIQSSSHYRHSEGREASVIVAAKKSVGMPGHVGDAQTSSIDAAQGRNLTSAGSQLVSTSALRKEQPVQAFEVVPLSAHRIGVVPFATRRNPNLLSETRPSAAKQRALLRRRCSTPSNFVLHKLSVEQLQECARHKAANLAQCTFREEG
eukprot:3100441-Pleurochrysis_carterae.AAC.2